jgi:cytochrome c peroxidase
MQQDIRPPHLPQNASVDKGRQLFETAGCADCHGRPQWTISTLPGPPGTLDADGNGMVDSVLRDVGTLNPQDIRGATGFDVPTLLNVRLTAPYFHDGSSVTLIAVLQSGHPTPTNPPPLTDREMSALVTFLQSIDPTTAPVSDTADSP